MAGITNMSVAIRPMQLADVDVVHDIERQSFSDPWSRGAFVQGLDEEWSASFVAVVDGVLVGYVCGIGVADELHIHNLAVQAKFRAQGIGRRLLRHAESWAQARGKLCVILDVRESNESARSLYASAGYEHIGRRKRYYRHPVEDALVLLKDLSTPPPRAET